MFCHRLTPDGHNCAAALLFLAASLSAVSGEPWEVLTRECAIGVPQPLQPHGQFGCPLPIDESVGPIPVKYTPWTHQPECTIGDNPGKTKYCAYTNSRHAIDGISLITRPETAANVVDLMSEVVGPLPRPMGNSTEPPYKITDIPGKGKGVVATRRISRYEEIMEDYAALVVDLYFPSAVKRQLGYDLLHTAADQLSVPDKVLTLGRSSTLAQDIIEDVLRTNAFHTPLGGEPHMALYPELSVESTLCRNPIKDIIFIAYRG
jgi:hypothetical protein